MCRCSLGRDRETEPDGVQVRFKKGDDPWELSAGPTVGGNITLTVPDGETDRFPDERVDWVLFTLLDGNDHVVGVGAGRV